MVCLTREQILGATYEPKRVKVPIKEWGGDFYVHEWTAAQQDEWEQFVVANKGNARAITAALSLYDADGARVFKVEDAEELGHKPGIGRVLLRIAKAANRLNRLDTKDFEEEQGNSEPGRSDSSASE